MSPAPALDRRQFIIQAASFGGGLAVWMSAAPGTAAALDPILSASAAVAGSSELTPWIAIAPDDTVTVRVNMPEIGNGVMTQALMTVTEELQCDWTKVRAEFASPLRDHQLSHVYSNQYGETSYFAGRSTHARRMDALLQIGANTRERLKAAAAAKWNVKPSEIEARNSVLTHKASGRSMRYGEIAEAAARAPLDHEPTRKPQSEWTFLGKASPGKLNNPLIVAGSATYGIDVRVPGMLYAALRQSPVHGGKLKGFDFDAIKNMPGVKGVAVVDPSEPRKPINVKWISPPGTDAPQSGIAVVAEHYWQAKKALDALPLEWEDGAGARWKSTREIYDAAIAELQQPGPKIEKQQGDAMRRLTERARKVAATYLSPYCDHMLMEPLNGTALVTADRVDLWHPTQHSQQAFLTAAEETGVPLENVHFHQPFVGGGFGRRAFCDDVRMVVAVAKRFPNQPVQVIWSREETMRQGRYRPLEAVKLVAALDEASMPVALLVRMAGRGLFVNGITDAVYLKSIPHYRIESREMPLHVLTGPYRGPGNNSNVFIIESFIDECAHAAQMDPLHYRMMLLEKWPDTGWKHCLREVASKSGWGAPLPKHQGRGVAIANWGGWGEPHQGTTVAAAATVEVTPEGELRILRVDVAFDCGRMLNQDAVLAQIEGATIYGMNMTLNEELNVESGRIVEGNIDQYPMMRLVDVPKQLHIHLGGLSHHDRYGEIGEAGVGPIGPAIGNAIFQACGRRLRQTPFRKLDLRTV